MLINATAESSRPVPFIRLEDALFLTALVPDLEEDVVGRHPQSSVRLLQIERSPDKAVILALKQHKHDHQGRYPPNGFDHDHEREWERVAKRREGKEGLHQNPAHQGDQLNRHKTGHALCMVAYVEECHRCLPSL